MRIVSTVCLEIRTMSIKSDCPKCGEELGMARLHLQFECLHCKQKFTGNGPWIGTIVSVVIYVAINLVDIAFNNWSVTLLVALLGVVGGMIASYKWTTIRDSNEPAEK